MREFQLFLPECFNISRCCWRQGKGSGREGAAGGEAEYEGGQEKEE